MTRDEGSHRQVRADCRRRRSAAMAHAYEGVVAKDDSSLYIEKRFTKWLKVRSGRKVSV